MRRNAFQGLSQGSPREPQGSPHRADFLPRPATPAGRVNPEVDVFTEGGHIEVGNPDFEVRRKGKGAAGRGDGCLLAPIASAGATR